MADFDEHSVITEIIAEAALPFILLYGAYVILNGHLSPGGGFSGGTILGAGFILYHTACAKRPLLYDTCVHISSISLLCYAVLKGYSFFMGGNHLPNGIPLGIPGSIFSSGLILPLNIAVGLTVACTMYLFYQMFESWEA